MLMVKNGHRKIVQVHQEMTKGKLSTENWFKIKKCMYVLHYILYYR